MGKLFEKLDESIRCLKWFFIFIESNISVLLLLREIATVSVMIKILIIYNGDITTATTTTTTTITTTKTTNDNNSNDNCDN